MQDNISKLYEALKDSYELGSENDFRNYLSDGNKREALRKELESEWEVGDSASFTRYLGLDGQSAPQTQGEQTSESKIEAAQTEPAKPAQPKQPKAQTKQEKPKAAAPITTQNIPSVQQMMDNRPQYEPASVGKTEEVEEEAKNEEEPQATANGEQKGRVVPTTADVLAMRERMNNIVNRSKATVRNAGKRMDAISKGNKMGDTSEMVFNPETNKWERKYYTTTGEVVDSKEAQSQINMANRDVWEATTEEGQKHRAKRIMNDYEERLGSVLERYDDENTAELAWQEAEDKTRAAQIPNPTGNSTIAAATLFANQVEHMKYHDLKRMADRSWEMLGKEKQQAIVDDIYDAMRPLYPELSDDDVRNEAKKTARQMSDQRLFELAVAKNAPKDATDYFFRKAVAGNSFIKVMEAIARSSAGTTGDMEARDVAEQLYGKDHKLAGIAGTVTGFAVDPLVWISAGAGGAATKGGMWLLGKKLGEEGVRKFATTLGGRILGGAIGGGANFATFESLGEALEQARYGGKVTQDEETGRYIVGDYSAGEVGKSALRGFALGTATGVVAPLVGNVSDKMVRATESTAGKLGVRAGELGVSTVAEGTIFSIPEWIEGKEDAMDVWTDNLAMMAGFKLQHGIKSAKRVISELSADPKGLKAGFETRLRSVLDGQEGLALTDDEKRELENGGYGDLKELVDEYKEYAKAKEKYNTAKPSVEGTSKMIEGAVDENAPLPYNRFVELMGDGGISEAARAKMYYYITGRMLPMSTIMGGTITEHRDADGNVTGYEVQSVGANGVITNKTFDTKERADVEMNRIMRQAELNTIDVGERYAESNGEARRTYEACQQVAGEIGVPDRMLYELMKKSPDAMDEVEREWAEKVNAAYEELGNKYSTEEMRNAINEEYGVDVDKAIRKEPNRRSDKEKEAVEAYSEKLFGGIKRDTEKAQSESPIDPNAPIEPQIAGLLENKAIGDPVEQVKNEAFQRGYDADEQERRDIAIALGAEPNEELQEAWNGVVERINEEAEYEAALQRLRARSFQHQDGTYKKVTLKDGKEVYVVDGNLVVDSEGKMDVKASDNVVVVYDAATGERKQINPANNIESVGEVVTQEDYDGFIEQAKKDYIQQQLDAAQGKLPFNVGDTYQVVDDEGNPHTIAIVENNGNGQDVVASMDGAEPAQMPMADIQAGADKASIYDVAQRAEEEVVPEPSEQVSNYTEGVPESYDNGVEIVVRNEEGKETPAMVMGRMRIEDGQFVPDDNGNIVEYLIDGDVAHDYINDLNEKVVRYNDNRQQTTDNGQDEMVGETGGEASLNTAGANEPPAATNEAPALEPVDENAMPMIGEGEDAEPDFLATTPQRGHQYLFDEMGINEKAAKGIVEANIKAASKDVEKQAKELDKLDNNPGANVVKYKRTREEIERKAVAAQTALDYWNAVKAEQDKRDAAAQQAAFEAATAESLDRQAMLDEQKDRAAKIEKAKQMYGDYFDSDFSVPQDVNELVAMNMPSEKISWEGREGVRGLQQELGSNHIRAIGNGSTNGFNTYLAKKGEGISTDKAIHDIWESPMNQLPNGEKRWDTEEIRNAFIDMFRNATKPSDIRDYVYNSRVRQAEQMRAAEDEAIAIAQMDEDIRQRMGMEKEEYDAWIADMVARAEAQAAYENETFNETNISDDRRTEESTGTEGTGEVQGQEGIGIGTEEDNPASVGRDGAGEDTGRVSAEERNEYVERESSWYKAFGKIPFYIDGYVHRGEIIGVDGDNIVVREWISKKNDEFRDYRIKPMHIKPQKLKLDGSSVEYKSVGEYNDEKLRSLAHGIREGNDSAINEAADYMSLIIGSAQDNKFGVLVPVPNHNGRATNILKLAEAISKRTNIPVADVLTGKSRESQYEAKKRGETIEADKLGISLSGKLPEGARPIIIDNVIGTGNTALACVNAIGGYVPVVTLADATKYEKQRRENMSDLPESEENFEKGLENQEENEANEQNSIPELTQSLNDRKHEVSLALDELIRAEKDNANEAVKERKAFHDANVRSKEAERALKAELDKLSDEDLARLAGEAGDKNFTLLNAIRDVQDARALKSSADDTFASGIAEHNVESIKHKTKFNPDSFTSKDEIRKTLNGVYHDESGYGVVGDGKILYYDKRLYDKKNKGKVVATHKMNDTAKGDSFEGKYPDWRGVIETWKPAKQVNTDIGALLDFLAGAENKLKEQWQNEKERNRNVGSFAKWLEGATVMLRMPDGSFVKMRYDILKKFAEGAENLGATSIGYTDYTEPLLAESKHGGVLAMPMNVRENGIVPPSDLYYDISGKEQVGKTEDVSRGNVVEFNITTYNDEKEEMKNIFRDGGWEEEQIDEIFSFADQVAYEIEQLRKASGLLDAFSGEPANPKREILKSNPDYAGSFDYSYDCVKKEAMNYIIEQMVALGKSSHLGLTQIEAIKKVLEKHGYLTPCVMCYVEGKRKLLKQSKETEQRWNAVADAAGLPQTFIGEPTELTDEQSGILRRLAEGKDIDKVDGGGERIPVAVVKQIASLMLGNDILRGRFDHQWLMTPSGYTNFYDKFSSTGIMGFVTLGQYKGKGLLGITPFSLQSIAPDRLDELFNPVKWAKEGGLRQFSYEDARPIMFFDYFQQMMLLQAAHAPLQLYTKREMMPDLFGETGAMINQSLVVDVWNGSEEHRQMLGLDEKAYDGWLREHAGFIPKGVLDGSGDMETLVPYYSKDSFPIEAAMRNAKDARFGGRVGNAVVAPSDAFIRWALDNPDIHQILAYHAMGTSPVQRALVGYDKATQYDRDYLTGDAHTNVNDVRNGIVVEGGKLKWNTLLRKYQREGKGAREAAQFYLDYCKENGIKPMFEKFADHPEYYKMLVDFRAYDEQGNSVKQKAVKATLPEGWQEKLSGYLGEQEQVTEAVQGIASNEDLQRELQQATKYVSLEPAERETTEKILGEIYGKENIFMLGGEEFDKALDAATEDGKANALRDAGGVVYGFTVGGKIYLSTDLFNAHTPLHEHGHIYMSVLEQIQPKLHQRGIELWKGTDMWEKIRQHLETLGEDTSDSHILSELAAQFTGKENEKVISEMTGITDKNWLQRAMSWLKELWAGVKSAFSKWTGKDLEELTPEQFISMPFRAFYDPEERAKYIKNLRAAREMGMAADMEAPITKNDDAAYKEAVDKGDTEAVQKMVDAAAAKAGYTIKAYHGTSRADRVGNVFRADRATSGPMAFFSDNEEIAESYAKGKKDTSIAYDTDYDSYETQFRSTHKATGKDYAIYDMWGFLPRSAQNEIAEKAKHVRKDWDGDGGIIYDPETTQANGGWDWQVKENRGNILKALDFQWLASGNLWNKEGEYLKVLELSGVNDALEKAGFELPRYMNPDYRDEAVYNVYLKIQNPFDTTTMVDENFIEGLKKFADEHEDEYRKETASADMWDKNNETVDEFIKRLRDDMKLGESFAWTSIPDVVSAYIKGLGYDGIKDTGGKNGGDIHTVWIPFESEQIKRSAPETYDDEGNLIPLSKRFNKESNDIRFHFVGEKGAAEADRAEGVVTRIENLAIAKQMEEDGKPALDIKMATGWERGKDGKWRYEIPDLRITGELRSSQKLGDIVDAPELIAAYPDITDVVVERYNNPLSSTAGGTTVERVKESKEYQVAKDNIEKYPTYESYLSDIEQKRDKYLKAIADSESEEVRTQYEDVSNLLNERIAESKSNYEGWQDILSRGNDVQKIVITLNTAAVKTYKEAEAVLIHEVQHVIQEKEGFAKGGNMRSILDDTEVRDAFIEDLRRDLGDVEHNLEVVRDAKASDKAVAKYAAERGISEEDARAYFDSEEARQMLKKKEYEHLFSMLNDDNTTRSKAFEYYQRIAGEVEARNAAARAGMTPEERRRTLASETEDILRGEQIVTYGDAGGSASIVEDEKEVARLDAEPKEVGYRNVVLNEDGTLGSPMANRLGKTGAGRKATSGFEFNKWERSDEHPELATDKGKIDLIKPDGNAVGSVDYNPYIHIRPTLVNKQFKQAWERPNLVYVRTEYPTSELDKGYKAEKAKLSVGKHPWNGGELILSRWDKPIEIVPWEEVADDWVKEFDGKGIQFDIIPPKLLPILAERGIEILPPHKGMGKNCFEAYNDWKAENQPSKLYRKPTFYSNAERAVKDIKQEKATPGQWLAMIQKAGGLKAGEDKWMGLTDWLKSQDKKSLNKQEVMDFIRSNRVEVEDVNYAEHTRGRYDEHWDYMREWLNEHTDKPDVWYRTLTEICGYSDERGFYATSNQPKVITDMIDRINDSIENVKPANSTRLGYTTRGLENKREIALVVPSIEPWNEGDEIHFGDAGNGRAIAWIRFGETTDADGKRVLVIDEIQSKRHQAGRERGYKVSKEKADAEMNAFLDRMREKYNYNPQDKFADFFSKDELAELDRLNAQQHAAYFGNSDVPDAPFDKNWHELAMKRMLRYAAENGYDKIAWTKGEQQAERYNIGNVVDFINVAPYEAQSPNEVDGFDVDIQPKNGDTIRIFADKQGNISSGEYEGRTLADVLGKPLANKILASEANGTIEGDGLRIGAEGMAGFYDNILPRFMDKYGKKWGVKTEEIELPNVEEAGRTMWAVDVTPEMKESVMQGQPMFRDGAYTPSYEESLAASQAAGYTKKQHDAWWNRMQKNMRKTAEDWAKKMHIADIVDIYDSASDLDGVEGVTDEDKQSKGWFDPSTGRIAVILGNHESVNDVFKTILHEGVNHYGLRKLFGDRFDTFLDNVFANATPEIRKEITQLAKQNGWNFHTATEEYLGKLAEDTDFENAEKSGWWQQIKRWFAEMLRTIWKNGTEYIDKITDNELRYVLWRSYQNLVNPGRYRSLVETAKDVAKQYELGVGKFAPKEEAEELPMAAEPTDQQRMAYALNAIKKYDNTLALFKGSNGFYNSTDRKTLESVAGVTTFSPRMLDEVMGKLIRSGRRVAVIDEFPQAAESGEKLHRADNLQERITEASIRLAQNHEDDKQLRNEAMRAIGGNLSDLRKAMSLQREFDKGTVKRVADLAKILMDNGYLNNMSQYEVGRLLSAVKNSTGKEDISESVQKVMDIMVDNQLKRGEDALHGLESIRGSKVDARGVEVQGSLDVQGQQIMQAFKQGRVYKKEEGLLDAIANAQERMGSSDAAVAEEAANEYTGLQYAMDYWRDIRDSKEEEQDLRKEIKNYDGAPEGKKEFVRSIEDAIRQNKIERAQAYFDLVGRMAGGMRESMENAKAFKEAEVERVREIQHNANSDMEGIPSKAHYQPKVMDKFVNNSFVQALFSPLSTFDQMLRMLGSKSANGEGYLYNRFMRGWVDARQNEIKGVRSKYAILDDKAKEIFGGNVKSMGDLIREVGKLPKATVSFWNGGEMEEHELTQGNLMYIYMVDKMLDGRMKLRRMGIKEEDVANITKALDPRLIEFADWMQDEFLVETRNEYNETHKRLFGAPMAAVENYFPLKILANARADKAEDLDNPVMNEGISTKTGSIIKRRRNGLALDILNADALNVVLDHVAKMEHWNAFAEFNRDLNTLRTYKHFRNQVYNMTSIYGSGDVLWQRFNDLSQMAAGTYRPKRAKFDEYAVNIAKGVTAAKVSFRLFTALKQFLSSPAYLSEARPDFLAKNIAMPWKAWDWSMEHLPIFEERWKSKFAGDPRLMKTELDWAGWRNNVVQIASRIGMSPNAFVDALTVSIGAHSIYETRKARYKFLGFSEEQAEKRAIQDAEIAYNQTQQSSEGAFLSPMQVDRTWASVTFTIFRNSPMAYQRQLHDALRNLKRNPLQRNESIEFMTKQLVREGIDEEKARKGAESMYNRQLGKDIVRVAVFGFILQLIWNMGAYVTYLLFGDDDDEKDKMWDDILTHSAFGSVEGLTGGDVLSMAGQMMLTGEGNPEYLVKDMPLASDAKDILREMGSGKTSEALTDMINLIVQAGIGVNPQSITDAALAIMDVCGGDEKLANEATIFIARVLQVPQSQIDKMYFDEINMYGSEAKHLSAEELAKRYAAYKQKRANFFAPWKWDDEKAIEKQTKKAYDLMKERLKEKEDSVLYDAVRSGDKELRKQAADILGKRIKEEDDSTLAQVFDDTYGTGLQKVAANEIAKRMGGTDSYGKSKADYDVLYKKYRSYVDLAEDITLLNKLNEAKKSGDKRLAKGIGKYREEIAKVKRGLTGILENDDKRMERIRELRRKALDFAEENDSKE